MDAKEVWPPVYSAYPSGGLLTCLYNWTQGVIAKEKDLKFGGEYGRGT